MFDTDFLNDLRKEELILILPYLGRGGTLLEFGAGTGAQAIELQRLGFDVVALDLANSGYSNCRVYPVIDYDGMHIPVPDGSVDIVFSSNVLEHVPNFEQICAEFARVLRPGGFCVHVMPSVAWRFWTFVSGFANAFPVVFKLLHGLALGNRGGRHGFLDDVKALLGCVLPIGHGTSREGLSELWTFSAAAWRAKFAKAGFRVDREESLRLFHTGHMFFGRKWSIDARKRASRFLGGAARTYFTSPVRAQQSAQAPAAASSA
jgi:SAM-dependent methyltransferase